MKIGRPLLFVLGVFICGAIPAHADEPQTYLASLLQEAHAKHLDQDRQWLLLLHYRRDLLRRFHSEVDDPKFFLSPQGRTDPAAELDATLKAFFNPVSVDSDTQHPQCLYPARYAWLKGQLHIDARLPDQPCSRYEKWRAQMDPESVTMIFASYYLNNPASMYGHTFLRMNKKGRGHKDPLLDYVLNFAAMTNSNNGMLFAILGLTGGYRGEFSTMPYYMKVQEYNNMDSRDLWEYDLNLRPEEIDRLVRHLWEMGQGSMAYYFFNKNCSYQLLPILEVARPTLHLTDPFWMRAIPADTLRRVIRQPEMLGEVRVRPSHVRRMLEARSALSAPEIHQAEHLARNAELQDLQGLQSFPKDRQAKILDSAYDLFRYRIGFVREQPLKNQEQERKLLLARNQLASSVPAPEPAGEGAVQGAIGEVSPDQGHATGRVGASFGWTKHTHFEEISGRAALHDQEDTVKGYIPGSQLQMFNARLRYDNDRQKTWLQEFTLIDILSLSPWDSWVRKPSWGIHTGFDVADDLDRAPEKSMYYSLRGGSGLAYKTHLGRGELFYALAQLDGGLGGIFEDSYRLGAGMNSGVSTSPVPWWQIHFNASYIHYPWGEPGGVVKLRLIQSVPVGRSMQLRCLLERQNQYKEILLSWLVYL